MNDEQIIQLYQQRNENAIAETSKIYDALCRRTAGNILSSSQDIDECVSDVYFKAWNSIPPDNPLSFSAYLTAITRNIALDKWRHNNRCKRGGGKVEQLLSELSDCVHSSEDIDEIIDEKLLTQTLDVFLEQLSYDSRTIFVQRYIVMLSIDEIAEQYDYSQSKVKSSLMRTRRKLHKYLKQEGWL